MTCLLEQLENRRANMLPQVRELCDEVDAALWENFRFPKAKKRKADKRFKVDGRAVQIQFTTANGERVPEKNSLRADRLAVLENYRKQNENGAEEITYDVNDDKQFSSMLDFISDAAKMGITILSEDDVE